MVRNQIKFGFYRKRFRKITVATGASMPNLAQRLSQARLDGTTVSVQSSEIIGSLDTAYTLQEQVFQQIGDISDSWKIGSTSAEAQAALGTTEPGAARIPKRFCFTSPSDVPIFTAHDVKLEAEFAFRLRANLPPRENDYQRSEVAEAVAGVAPALEIVGSRLSGGLTGAGRYAVTADGGANIALVTSQFVTDWQRFDLPSHRLFVALNGTVRAEGEGRRALGDPLNVLIWLANRERERNGLKAGETVTTGTCSGLLEIKTGDTVVADFGTLGTVQANFVDAETIK
jgi:2-keto-4-pentenoate hydratase